MKIIDKKLTEITPYGQNPRKNDEAVDKVASSIQEFGFKQPIVVDKDGVIIVGHTRYKAAQKLGLESVPVLVADDLTEEQAKAYRLADNKTNEFAEWDFELLNAELFDIENIDMKMFGFVFDEAEKDTEIIEDEYTEEVEPVAKLGDMWQLGKHRLICGDATSLETIEKLTDGELMDLLVTDPPYNVDVEGQVGKIMNDNMDTNTFRQFLKASFLAAFSFLRGGCCVLHLALRKRGLQL